MKQNYNFCCINIKKRLFKKTHCFEEKNQLPANENSGQPLPSPSGKEGEKAIGKGEEGNKERYIMFCSSK
jgi:hypothetical protein